MFPGYLVIMLAVYSLVFVTGFVGNLWVIMSLVLILYDNGFPMKSKLKRVSVYVLALSVVDLLVLSMIPMLMHYFLKGAWQFGYIACKLFWTVENVNKLLSIAILTIMTFERYLGVCKPFHRNWLRNYNAGIAIVLLLFFIVLLCVPIIYYSGTTEHVILTSNMSVADTKWSCSSDLPDSILPYFILYMFVFGFVSPVIFITLCYVFIIYSINVKSKRRASTRNVIKANTSSNRVIRSILWVVVFHFVCWTPFWAAVLLTLNTTSNLTEYFVVSPRILAMIRLVTSFLPYINSAGNWIFYAAFNREIQQTSREIRIRHARKFQQNMVVGTMLHRALSMAYKPSRAKSLKQNNSYPSVLEGMKSRSMWGQRMKVQPDDTTLDTTENPPLISESTLFKTLNIEEETDSARVVFC
ncbi:hypothetical protein L596_020551 [Steinernema carpocapsae]|uniref:G-protein coupled receptors family 1 profile domain-containing protein n=1 Tax=Steinernema carpocapsae TaxID=34508 RepID=A0A4U5MU25_STECR|nr:hypothetical protein L596_020551 [Steinernema carpocapsae]